MEPDIFLHTLPRNKIKRTPNQGLCMLHSRRVSFTFRLRICIILTALFLNTKFASVQLLKSFEIFQKPGGLAKKNQESLSRNCTRLLIPDTNKFTDNS